MIDFFKQLFNAYANDDVARLAAAIAYYTIFAIAPILIIVIAVAGVLLGQASVQSMLVEQIQSAVGSDAANFVTEQIERRRDNNSGLIASLIASAMLLVGATGVFSQLQGALNKIWHVDKNGGLQNILWVRLRSFLLLLVMGILIILSFLLSSALSVLRNTNSDFLPGSSLLWQGLELLVSLALITLLFALIYKYLPDRDLRWRDIWVGAISSGVLFMIGRSLIGFYLANSGLSSSYGAAGSVVVFLFWVFYSAQIFLIGAEISKVYVKQHNKENRNTSSESLRSLKGM